jgi:NitT/TauT family transport system permease protein
MSASATATRSAIASPDGDETPVLAARASRGEQIARVAIPLAMLIAVLAAWHLYVTLANVPHYVLPSPVLVVQSLITDWPILFKSLLITLKTTLSALALALVGGVLLAVAMAQSRLIELAIYPYAVILQVTPIVAVSHSSCRSSPFCPTQLRGFVRPTTICSTCLSSMARAAGKR